MISMLTYFLIVQLSLVHHLSLFDGADGGQADVTEGMRAVLVDWLIEVADEYRLHVGTLFLTVHLLDATLHEMPVRRTQFQLLGCACLVVACKLEEQLPPVMANLVELAAQCFSCDDLLEMEQRVMKVLTFDLNLPTRVYFGERLCVLSEATDREKSLVNFFLELSLLVCSRYCVCLH